MIKQNKAKGCATLCIGGGMGIAICVEKKLKRTISKIFNKQSFLNPKPSI